MLSVHMLGELYGLNGFKQLC